MSPNAGRLSSSTQPGSSRGSSLRAAKAVRVTDASVVDAHRAQRTGRQLRRGQGEGAARDAAFFGRVRRVASALENPRDRDDPSTSFLSMTLGNHGQFIHPGLMYGLFRDWDGEEYDSDALPRFYGDTTEGQGELGSVQLSAEATSVARELERESNGALDLGGALPVHEWLRVSYRRRPRTRAPLRPLPDGAAPAWRGADGEDGHGALRSQLRLPLPD